ncbi:Mu transposase C-terminal domain-containing protein [uncultured Pelagimonas sp.]|uniref:Mu transposase C-terminal domain-containing protein n=1 Tax=uncultured Pelagimonas sp. TaxID=1618102 RepID=UPI002621AFA3|nr:Mu transposase C-terminal domain-containing protein [uncultured Pelagimonas sp.]
MIPKIHLNPVHQYMIDRVPYHFETGDNHSAYFRREDGSGAVERFGWEELNGIVGTDRWECKRRSSTSDAAENEPDPHVFIWELSETQRILFLRRWFFVLALNKLYAGGSVKLTPEDVKANFYDLLDEATKIHLTFNGQFGVQYFCSKDNALGYKASPSKILEWRRRVEQAYGRIDVLVDQRGKSSEIDIDQESFVFIIKKLRNFLSQQQSSANGVVDETIKALRFENEQRNKDGLKLLETRGRTQLHEWVANFGPVKIEANRKGKSFAKRKYSGVGKTEQAIRPGQTFIVDEWEVDARNVIMSGPMREGLDDKTIKALPRGRRWLYIVIDVATRYIVGFFLSTSQKTESAVRSLHMATRDKTDLAKAAGAESDWHGFSFESLESDTGAAFYAEPTQRAVSTAYATYVFPMVGEPQFRGIIERVFGTFRDRAMPFIPGRTFSNPQQRGDYPTEELAVLTDDQLALIFIRYIVDVYHHSMHRGLGGETPAAALARLGGLYGVPPKLSPNTLRRAFGSREERTVTARGIQFLGIHYNSKELQQIRQERGSNKRAFFIDPDDLGTISVWNNDHWVEVRCSVEKFHNIRLVDWIEVGKILRSRYSAQAEIKTSVIMRALADMRSRATDALKIMNALPQMLTADDLERLDRELYWGLSVVDDAPATVDGLKRAEDGLGYVIGGASTDSRSDEKPTPPVSSLPTSEASNEPPEAGDVSEDDWWGDGAEVGEPRHDFDPAQRYSNSSADETPSAAPNEDDDDWWREEDEK